MYEEAVTELQSYKIITNNITLYAGALLIILLMLVKFITFHDFDDI